MQRDLPLSVAIDTSSLAFSESTPPSNDERGYYDPYDIFDDESIDIEEGLMGDSPIATMCYQNANGEGSTRPIIVKDVFYSDNNEVWYIKAVDKNVDKVKTFRVDRVVFLRCNNQTYFEQKEIVKLADGLSGWV